MADVATNTPDTGLTSEQARDRLARGLGNDSGQRSSRSLSEILRANIFTRFNAILATMLVIILVVGVNRHSLKCLICGNFFAFDFYIFFEFFF